MLQAGNNSEGRLFFRKQVTEFVASPFCGVVMINTLNPAPWIHQTDLFRPHADPDDHWDLACVYALAKAGRAELKGIVIDYPPANHHNFNPDLEAVAQLNHYHVLTAPVVVGSALAVRSITDTQIDAPPHERGAVNFIINTLEKSPQPVVIHLAGSCRDVALAANTAPDLFAKKCARIYLNAGMAKPHPEYVEYNVRVNPAAFAAIFRAPCPIFWLPCFDTQPYSPSRSVEEFGAWYDFRQGEIFPQLSVPLQNYFASVLGKVMTTHWLQYLQEGDSAAILRGFSEERRNMWCTAGFFNAAGLTVTESGQIIALTSQPADAVFEFIPVEIGCAPDGKVTWNRVASPGKDRLFRIRNLPAYPAAMTAALRTLLSGKYA
jgi:hypothetical protein